jgi:hypothetical protein
MSTARGVALNANQGDQATPTGFVDLPDDAVGPDPRVGFVPGDPELDVFTQHPPLGAVQGRPFNAASVLAGIEER